MGPHRVRGHRQSARQRVTPCTALEEPLHQSILQGVKADDHEPPTDGEEIQYISMQRAFEITNSYTTAFFGRYLKGLTGYDEYLAANHYPDDIIYKNYVPSGDG